MNVQAFLSNVSFPKNIKDLDYYADQFDVEVLMCSEWVEWTVIITGYAGIGIGFFGGVIYYMRQA